VQQMLERWASQYNDPKYFQTDPIAFPTRFKNSGSSLQDIEIAAVLAAHLAWGRRQMIVRDCGRLFDEMDWKPYDYVMRGKWRNDGTSLHRTIKWSEFADICSRLQQFYLERGQSLEILDQSAMRTEIFGQKPDSKAANKKINMLRRWMVRNDGKVDLGLWKNTDPANLVIPLDIHVYNQAAALGLTNRKSKDLATAMEITEAFKDIFPGDPVKGDFALFGYGVSNRTDA